MTEEQKQQLLKDLQLLSAALEPGVNLNRAAYVAIEASLTRIAEFVSHTPTKDQE